jgi:uncharacterized protein
MTTPAPPAQAHAFTFDCEGETLVGLLHRPAGQAQDRDAARTGVVVVVGGPQYRAGSHRQFVHLAQHLAAAGHPVLRFDARGMGDSSGAQRSFEDLDADIGAAIQALVQHQPEVQRVVLWGLCDGASAALLYLQRQGDPRVRGLCLLNPWVRSEASLARTQVKHYYRQRLMQREFWAKLFSGQVAGKAVRDLVGSLKAARQPVEAAPAAELPFQVRMARAWQSFDGPVLLVLSGRDYTAREFTETVAAHPAWNGALARPGVQRHDARAADHTFSAAADRIEVEQVTAAWLAGPGRAGTGTAGRGEATVAHRAAQATAAP